MSVRSVLAVSALAAVSHNVATGPFCQRQRGGEWGDADFGNGRGMRQIATAGPALAGPTHRRECDRARGAGGTGLYLRGIAFRLQLAPQGTRGHAAGRCGSRVRPAFRWAELAGARREHGRGRGDGLQSRTETGLDPLAVAEGQIALGQRDLQRRSATSRASAPRAAWPGRWSAMRPTPKRNGAWPIALSTCFSPVRLVQFITFL